MKEMDGQVALVTGGSSGIGRAAVLAFARQGARVVIADVDISRCREVAAEVEEGHSEALCVGTDVSKSEQVQNLIARTVEVYGRLDYAFNNAGIGGESAPLAEYPEDDWHRLIGINLTGVWLCTKYELQQMAEQGEGGAIVNMSSILGQVGFANASAYVAAKHGVIGLTKTAALEYADQGIRVNAVCPGFVETPMLERAGILGDPEMRAQITALHPVGRLGRPEEVAAAVVWLCSEAASFVTGQALLIDGGYVAR